MKFEIEIKNFEYLEEESKNSIYEYYKLMPPDNDKNVIFDIGLMITDKCNILCVMLHDENMAQYSLGYFDNEHNFVSVVDWEGLDKPIKKEHNDRLVKKYHERMYNLYLKEQAEIIAGSYDRNEEDWFDSYMDAFNSREEDDYE